MAEPQIRPLRLARVTLPDFHPEAPGACDVFGFLVRDGPECILVDTGVGRGNDLIDRLYRPERMELTVALATAGASLDEVTAVVNSHLHFDHCGNNALFPGAPIFVQGAELQAAAQPAYTVREWVDFKGASYVPVDGRRSISARLELLPTPGHTPGHQSLLVHSSGGTDVIVAQAAYTALEFESSGSGRAEVPDGTWSGERYVRSLAALHQLRPRRAFFSHDSRVWSRDA